MDNTINKNISKIPDGIPKSGRFWKTKQKSRSSSQVRKGVLSHLSLTFEERQLKQAKIIETKLLENKIKEESRSQRAEKKARVQEIKKIRQANEMKSSTYQVIKGEKLKSMSKKQLRMIKKTVVNQNGQVLIINLVF